MTDYFSRIGIVEKLRVVEQGILFVGPLHTGNGEGDGG
jgi:hypothetical protein